jgi:uncharacterized protein (TIGR03083 family)
MRQAQPGSSRAAEAAGIEDSAMRAFIATVAAEEPSGPTWCPGWSVQEIAAHVTGAAEERADLITEHLAGQPGRPTRSWEEREPPLRALPAAALRGHLVAEAVRFEQAAARMRETDVIEYTGWPMTAELLRRHSRSEAALHRWDLVGDDQASRQLLTDPALARHALAAFAAIPALPEARRWAELPPGSLIRLRVAGEPDVLARPGQPPTLVSPDGLGTVIELDHRERLLVLWGRVPARLRDHRSPGDGIDDILQRLTQA